MKLRFFWYAAYKDRVIPWCEASRSDKAGFSLIETYLLGEEGFSPVQAADSVIGMLDDVATGAINSQWLHGEVIEAEIDADVVTITASADGTREQLKSEEFRRVLVAWRDFIQAGPEGDPQMRMEIKEL